MELPLFLLPLSSDGNTTIGDSKYNANLIYSPTFTPGKFGNALTLTGTQYGSINYTSELNFNSGCLLYIVLYMNHIATSGSIGFLGRTDPTFRGMIYKASSSAPYGQLIFNFGNGTVTTPGATFTENSRHLVLLYAKDNILDVRIDGISYTGSFTVYPSLLTDLLLGTHNISAPYYWEGQIEQFAAWNSNITSDLIQTLEDGYNDNKSIMSLLLNITNTSLPTQKQGNSTNIQLNAEYGSQPYNWSII